MIGNFVIRNFMRKEFSALETLLLRNFVIRYLLLATLCVRNFFIRNFVIRNFVPAPSENDIARRYCFAGATVDDSGKERLRTLFCMHIFAQNSAQKRLLEIIGNIF